MIQRKRSPGNSNLNEAAKRPFLNNPAGFALCEFLHVAGVFSGSSIASICLWSARLKPLQTQAPRASP